MHPLGKGSSRSQFSTQIGFYLGNGFFFCHAESLSSQQFGEGIKPFEAHGLLGSRHGSAVHFQLLVDAWLGDLRDYVWSFLVCAKFACFLFHCVFIDFTENKVTFYEVSVINFLVVVLSRKLLIVLYPKEGLISLFLQSIKIFQEHIVVKFGVLLHYCSSQSAACFSQWSSLVGP